MSLINSRSATLLLGISACGMMGYLLYSLLRDRREDDDYLNAVPTSSNYKRHEIRVPKNAVRAIIGRKGKEIKRLQELSNTKINFKNGGEDEKQQHRVVVIRGTAEACRVAENLIQEVVFNQSLVETTEMWVPNASVGRIIGRCGENITEITANSGAKVTVCDEKANNPNTRITIKGTKNQISMAQNMIQKVIEKTVLSKSFIDSSLAKREPRLPPKSLDVSKAPSKPKVEDISSPDILGPPDNQFEVYVSAMMDPSHFWLQIVGPKATELDQLVEEMSEYYGREESREIHALTSVQKGDLVAAVFQYDDKWYRAEVLDVHGADSQAELYYVDYGDTDNVPVKDLYELRTDFLRLHFQAIECYLARVEPADGEAWSDEAIDKFEEWTHVAQWKKLSAKVNGYSIREKTRAKREGSPVPGVDLFDVSNDQDVDIAQELVKHSYAIFIKKERESQDASRATSHSSVNSIS